MWTSKSSVLRVLTRIPWTFKNSDCRFGLAPFCAIHENVLSQPASKILVVYIVHIDGDGVAGSRPVQTATICLNTSFQAAYLYMKWRFVVPKHNFREARPDPDPLLSLLGILTISRLYHTLVPY